MATHPGPWAGLAGRGSHLEMGQARRSKALHGEELPSPWKYPAAEMGAIPKPACKGGKDALRHWAWVPWSCRDLYAE